GRTGALHLMHRFGFGVALEEFPLADVEPLLARPGHKDRGDAGLPVDQRAIAVEAQRLELAEPWHQDGRAAMPSRTISSALLSESSPAGPGGVTGRRSPSTAV